MHGTINILWIKMAFTIEEAADRYLADLLAEIVRSLRAGARNGGRR